MNAALKEAFRTIPFDKINCDSEALKKCKQQMQIQPIDNEKWLKMPRKYTRNSARFSLPINTHDLATLTPFAYVSQHVWISNYRKQLYQYVFTKFLPEKMEAETAVAARGYDQGDAGSTDADTKLAAPMTDRTIGVGDLQCALKDVLGFHGTDERVDEIRALLLLDGDEIKEFNFRCWCGIVAFGERYLNKLSHAEDPCDEVRTVSEQTIRFIRDFTFRLKLLILSRSKGNSHTLTCWSH